MKVLLLGKMDLLKSSGGDRIQIENTAEELRNLGVEVEIYDQLNFNPELYDLIHIFQLDWAPESYLYAKKAKKFGKNVVLSPIHHNVNEVKRFDEEYTFDFRRVAKHLFKDQYHRDTFKDIYRCIFKPKKLMVTLTSMFKGLFQMQKETLAMSDAILVQTKKEAEDLQKNFNVDFKWYKVENGVSKAFTNKIAFTNHLNLKDYLICVGRIEPRKNQLNIIEAVKSLRVETGLDLQLVLIGKKSRFKHFEYNLRFANELQKNPWINYLGGIPYQDMPSYYHFAKVCVSASWFETTGLTSLEALVCNTNAVASGERASEYLGDQASYCDPGNVKSIKEAIKREYEKPRPQLDPAAKSLYSWKTAAEKTFEVYKEILKYNY